MRVQGNPGARVTLAPWLPSLLVNRALDPVHTNLDISETANFLYHKAAFPQR